MITYNLKDTSFAHIEYSAPGLTSDLLKWDRTCKSNGPTFYTHEQILKNEPVNHSYKYGWLIESRAIIPGIYNQILSSSIAGEYQYIFTHSSELLSKLPNARFSPGGGIWVGGSYGGGEIKLYAKTKLCSFVSSNKRMCPLHHTRAALYDFVRKNRGDIDCMGTLDGQWVPIIQSLKDYCYSIVIENYIDNEYFTEKILNCFATGTIPIYLGARRIDTFFNSDGIIRFNEPAGLLSALSAISFEDYAARSAAIAENFDRCKTYRLLEDYIVRGYL